MAYVVLLLVVVADNVFHLLAPERFGLRVAGPDLALVTALYIGFHARRSGQLGHAVVLGLFADCFSTGGLGHFGFLYGAAAYVAWRIRRFLPPDAAFSYVVACLFCALVTTLFALFIALVTLDGAVGAGLGRALLQSLSSALVAPFLFGILSRTRLLRTALGGPAYDFA